MTDKETHVKDRCIDICNTVDETTAVAMIKEEFQGCSVKVRMTYGDRGRKRFMGMMMWEDISTNF